METPEKFLSWLEGYLDATTNTLTPKQVKEIRKKITEVQAYAISDFTTGTFALVQPDTRQSVTSPVVPIYDSAISTSTHTVSIYDRVKNTVNDEPINEEFLAAIEKNKNVSSLEELFEEK
jgi:hypothetical protein